MGGMEEVALFALVARLVYATAALVLILLTLRWFNGLNNRGTEQASGFDAALKKIRASGNAAAVYYGLRFVGVCILYGMVMS